MTPARQRVRDELGALAHLALPAIATQVGSMFMGVVDTLMVARVSTESLAATVTIAGQIFPATVSVFYKSKLDKKGTAKKR